jgi:CdiI N-terminal domain
MFDNHLSSETLDEADVAPALWGRIQFGSFKEDFTAYLCDWPPEQHRRQWLEAAERLLNGESKSAFVTMFVSPKNGGHFEWWPCYRVGEVVYFQNQFLSYERIASPFAVESLYEYVSDRETLDDDGGVPISEWEVPLQWVRDFVGRDLGG